MPDELGADTVNVSVRVVLLWSTTLTHVNEPGAVVAIAQPIEATRVPLPFPLCAVTAMLTDCPDVTLVDAAPLTVTALI
jgi:hypothetical protein